MRKFYLIGLIWACMIGGTGAARADVTLCNYTGGLLQFAVAHPVTQPYETNFISGWTQLKNNKCVTAVVGKLSQSFPFYFLTADANADVYRPKGVDRGYDFCVTTEPFERRGSWNKLQTNCPSGWFKIDFNGVEVAANKDKTLKFY
jgi:uncharacterized membrane protein